MRLTRRYLAPIFLVAIVLSQSACPFGSSTLISGFRSALAASGPLVNQLVSRGAITQAQADAIRTDFDDAAVCAQSLDADFKLIPKDDPNVRSRKLSASVKAMRCWRVIVNRQNFAANIRIQQAIDIADGILASLVVFYSDGGVIRNEVGRRPTITATSEEEFRERVKEQIRALKEKLKAE